jgi:ABC-type multidrug transport system fused ATPase/permease subunit
MHGGCDSGARSVRRCHNPGRLQLASLVERLAVSSETAPPEIEPLEIEPSEIEPSEIAQRRTNRAREYAAFIRAMVAREPKTFAIAVGGASLYALCTVASSVVIRWVIDHVIVPRFEQGDVAAGTVATGCALIIGVGVLRAIGVVIRRCFAGITQWRIAQGLGDDVVDQLVAQPASWHQRQSDGQLVGRAGVDIDTTVGVMAPIPFATGVMLLIVVSAIWLLATDLVLGIVAVSVFPVLMLMNVVYQKRVDRHYDAAQQSLGDFSGAVHESFEGVQLVKAYGAEERETQRLSGMAAKIRDSRIRAVSLRGTFEALLEVIPSITNIGLVILGAVRVDSGAVSIGELSGFIYMFTLLVFPLRLIGYALSELPHSSAGYRRVRATIEEPLERDPEQSIVPAVQPDAVVFDDVSYTFADTAEPTIEHATFTIPAGSVTAFVGPTGSGKTTLVELIAGLVGPTEGRVALTPGERAIVFQEPFLFGGTVRDNVSVGLELGDQQVWDALRMAAADDFVRDLEAGIDTVVGERGVTLSGGQRQRIALARALARNPRVLLLDDTTSALDPGTEMKVLANLRAGLGHSTVVMVASRPSTIALADDVLFVEAGRITAHGTHDELMADVDAYRQLVEAFESDRSVPT